MAWPGLSFREQLQGIGQTIVDELDGVLAQLVGYLSVEHNSDGTHGAITATSIVTSGDSQIGGDLDVLGNLFIRPSDTPQSGWHATDLVIGSVELPGGTAGNGFLLPGTSAATKWGLLTDASVSGVNDLVLAHGSATNQAAVKVGALSGDAANGWAIWPGNGTDGGDLGVDASGKRWRSLFVNEVFEAGRTTALGEWVTPTFAAGDYTASAGTWTVASGDVSLFRYTVVGKMMTCAFRILTTSTSAGMGTELRIAIPGGYSAVGIIPATCHLNLNGTYETGLLQANTAGYIQIFRNDFTANFPNGLTNTLDVRGQITFEVS